MKVALAQINTTVGDLASNEAKAPMPLNLNLGFRVVNELFRRSFKPFERRRLSQHDL